MARFLTAAVQSIINNKFQDIEIIIGDDGSTDNTCAVAGWLSEEAESRNISLQYYRGNHRGKAACLNQLLNSVPIQGNYIIFMDADDLLPPKSLQHRFETAISSGADLLLSGFSIIDLYGNKQKDRLPLQDVKNKFTDQYFFSYRSPFHLNSAIIRKDLLVKTGLFDRILFRGQDADYLIRLLRKAERVKVLHEVTYLYRKYRRPLGLVVRNRLRTLTCRSKVISKHLSGSRRYRALVQHIFLDYIKLFYELVIQVRYE